MASDAMFGGIEGGGTKFVCALGRSPVHIVDSVSLPTRDAATTLQDCVRFLLEAQKRHGTLASIGFSCFGPIELRPGAAGYGRMLSTPKAGWSGVDVLAPLRAAFAVPLALDTDVGAAALAEWKLGAGQGLGSVAYVTVGTGIGGAVAPAGNAARRLMHAEMGHLPVKRDPRDLHFAGVCPFHGDCLEGLASGPAVRARWGCHLDELPREHVARSIIANYLGQMVASIALMHSVERVVFGGGVMSDGTLLPLIRKAAFGYLNGYLPPLAELGQMKEYVSAPGLGARAGIAGALLLTHIWKGKK
ncbi:MAG: ROK family protein [Gammaproteobacteria bacterium]